MYIIKSLACNKISGAGFKSDSLFSKLGDAMRTIEVDFEVYKALMLRRQSEEVSFNDVLRELLKLDSSSTSEPKAKLKIKRIDKPWVSRGVKFPHGTEFRSHYNGVDYQGQVDDGALVVEGERFDSASEAAFFITGDEVDGWYFWECKLPGKNSWNGINSLR